MFCFERMEKRQMNGFDLSVTSKYLEINVLNKRREVFGFYGYYGVRQTWMHVNRENQAHLL